ncbi:Por secretion system C-terminal sorting domain-containing protein [Salinimicrobium catena]|uniref:Por secretion system C-terminal sorting domain-containing protein n=1 Tax=Salinimicrobium catena TaxID=390640 RepID=A0A1H5PBH6_9FLAO|nr:T9SS type A sorting domain-containing protein [Salinimicrobium catena]SDL77921.1 Por secretion system C-terminal sorting domain-containing protein [Salinimicrobium catena]SEF11235.1 Por secretion system C-terminal sorting domain-containing protein [Salinimicrobium catena]
MRLTTLTGKYFSAISEPKDGKALKGLPYTMMALVLIFFVGINGMNAQETVEDIFDLPAPERCVSEDLQVVGATLDIDPCGPADCVDVEYYDLILAIDNTTGSERTSFAFYARLEQYNPDGTLAATYFVSGCKGPVPPNQITSLTFDESLEVLDENGDPTGFPGIPYLCGGGLKLVNLYEAWTDASDNENRQCPLDASKIAPKCDVLPMIEIQTPINAYVEDTTPVSCFGYADGAIDITVSGGETPYTYVWSKVGGGFSATTQDVSGLYAGTYNVTITDANDCPFTIEGIVITQPTELQATQGTVVAASCYGYADGSIAISVAGGTPPYTFAWTGPDGYTAMTEDISGLEAGSYSVTVTDANDCTDTLSAILVGEPDELVATLDEAVDASCYGYSDGSITIDVVGGTPDYTYAWTGPDGFTASTQDISGLAAGSYSVTVTDENDCEDTITGILVGEPAELVATVAAITDATCAGFANGAIDISVTGGTAPYTYLWSNGATTQDISGISAGSYSVTVTDANDCEDTISGIEVDDPSNLEATATTVTDVSCYGFEDGAIDITVTGGTPPYSFEWSNGATTEDVSGLDAGTYWVTVTDDNECEYTLSDITVGEPTEVPMPDVQVAPADCFQTSGSFSIVNAPADFEYSLDGGDWFSYTGTITGVTPGPHSLVARDANGCESQPRNFDVPQPFETPAAPTLEAVQPDCDTLTGAIIVTSSTVGYMFSINGADFVAYPMGGFTGLAPGDYQVRVRSNDGCISDISYITLEEPICEDFVGCTLGYWKNHTDRWCSEYQTCDYYGDVFEGAPEELAGEYLIDVLNMGGGGIYNLGRQSVAALLNACSEEVNYELATPQDVIDYVTANFDNAGEAGSYLDMLNNTGECPMGGSRATTAPSPGCEVNGASMDASAGISVSPVPFKDQLNIKYEFDYESAADIHIFDMRGNLVKSHRESNAGKGKVTTINADFVRGEQMYIIKVTTDQGTYTKNVVSGKK